ncbi:MAG TPA: hypothetical protein VJU81_24885 [Methylomirabilota bacterium]|nr:hypothetical protein [Methylomirabilota bacterium]
MTAPLRLLGAPLLLTWLIVGPAQAGEWEAARDNLEAAVRAQATRIAELEARERGVRDPERRAEKITRDRAASLEAVFKGGRIPPDPAQRLAAVTNEWRADGPERRALREGLATLQKNLERANASLGRTTDVAEAASHRLARSGLLQKFRRLEDEERARVQWQLDQAARERDRLQRERQAGERERGVR